MAVSKERAQELLEQRAAKRDRVQQNSGDLDMRGIAQQLAQGMLLSFSDELIGVMAGLRGSLDGSGFGEQYTTARDIEREQQQAFAEENPATALGLNVLGGILTGGAGFAGLKAAGASTRAAAATTPALEGAIAATGASERPGFESLADAPLGAAAGVAMGAAGNAITRGFGGRAAGDVIEATADDLGKTAAQRSKDLGITLTLGEELADNARKQSASLLDALPVSKRIMASRGAKNQKAINRAVLKRFGINGEKVTGRRLERIEEKANALYDDFARIVGSGQFQRTDSFREAMGEAVRALKAADDNPTLKKEMQKVARIVTSGRGTGKAIKRRLNEIRDLSRRARRANKQDLADGYDALQDALFNALDPGTGDAAREALGKAARYWRDMKTIDSSNVLESVTGNIKPAGLSNALGRNRFTRRAFTRNAEPDNEIFEIGRLMRQVGEDPDSIVGHFRSSRTSERNVLNQIIGFGVSPVTGTMAAGQVTQAGQRAATEIGRRATASGARAAGAATQ